MTDGGADPHDDEPAELDGPDETFGQSQPFEPIEPIDPVRRTQHRGLGALLAAGMLGLDEALGRKPKDEAPIVVDADGQPVDIDTDGIRLSVATDAGDDVAVSAPALPRSAPLPASRAGRRRGAPRRT